jgi:hypothetical protein
MPAATFLKKVLACLPDCDTLVAFFTAGAVNNLLLTVGAAVLESSPRK